jgi:hypothetical protein
MKLPIVESNHRRRLPVYRQQSHAFSKEQIEDLKVIYKILSEAFTEYEKMEKSGITAKFSQIVNMRETSWI